VAAATALAFIGLGQMGTPMVRNLLRAGFAVRGHDLDPQAVARFADAPAFSAMASPAAAATDAALLILMLPDSRIVDELLWRDGSGLAARLARGQVVVDMGSSDPVHSRANAARLAALGIGFVDAPVSGGVRRAVDGSLSIMIGGEAATVERVRPVLQALGKTLVHVGDAGAGHAVKALNNYVSAAGLLAVCEALVAAERFGIDPHLVNQVFNASTGKNNTTEHKVESFMLSERFDSGFALALMRKDLQTAQGFIERMGSARDFATACLRNWQQAEQALGPGADHTAMFRHVRAPR
jgi:3-hydroxyisobutyrate dehydrogenase